MTYQAVPVTYADEKAHRRVLAEAINRILQGKINCFIEFTSDHDQPSTVIQDARISAYSVLVFMPTTANAATDLANLYVPETSMLSGQATVFHSNAATTDRSYRVGILG